jgi:membrane protein YqaA with SNARE-associated domain
MEQRPAAFSFHENPDTRAVELGDRPLLRSSYNRLMQLAGTPYAAGWLALEAFCEGIFFPIPPDLMLMPMVLASPRRSWIYAGVCLLASLAGGSVGYSIGYFVEPVGKAILALTGNANGLESFRRLYASFGLILIALPIPYKLIAIASGFARFSYPEFLLASALIRGARFFLVAGLLRQFGEPIRGFIEKRLVFVVSAVALALVAGLLILRFHP